MSALNQGEGHSNGGNSSSANGTITDVERNFDFDCQRFKVSKFKHNVATQCPFQIGTTLELQRFQVSIFYYDVAIQCLVSNFLVGEDSEDSTPSAAASDERRVRDNRPLSLPELLHVPVPPTWRDGDPNDPGNCFILTRLLHAALSRLGREYVEGTKALVDIPWTIVKKDGSSQTVEEEFCLAADAYLRVGRSNNTSPKLLNSNCVDSSAYDRKHKHSCREIEVKRAVSLEALARYSPLIDPSLVLPGGKIQLFNKKIDTAILGYTVRASTMQRESSSNPDSGIREIYHSSSCPDLTKHERNRSRKSHDLDNYKKFDPSKKTASGLTKNKAVQSDSSDIQDTSGKESEVDMECFGATAQPTQSLQKETQKENYKQVVASQPIGKQILSEREHQQDMRQTTSRPKDGPKKVVLKPVKDTMENLHQSFSELRLTGDQPSSNSRLGLDSYIRDMRALTLEDGQEPGGSQQEAASRGRDKKPPPLVAAAKPAEKTKKTSTRKTNTRELLRGLPNITVVQTASGQRLTGVRQVQLIDELPPTAEGMTELYRHRVNTNNIIMMGDITSGAIHVLHGQLSTMPKSSSELPDPPTLTTKLLPHQRQALSWMAWREKQIPSGGILADDMGLGKTLTMIALVTHQQLCKQLGGKLYESEVAGYMETSATLVICPTSVLYHWELEVNKRTEGLSVICYHGANRTNSVQRLAAADFVLTTYALVSRELPGKSKKNRSSGNGDQTPSPPPAKSASPLVRLVWRRIILDEGHTIRNSKTKTATAICELKARSRWTISGTPIQNRMLDMYSQLKFLRCGPFDQWEVWKKHVENGSAIGRERLNTVVRSLLLRRTKAQKIPGTNKQLIDLPERRFVLHSLELSELERKIYDKLYHKTRQTVVNLMSQKKRNEDEDLIKFSQSKSDTNKTGSHVLLMLLRLRQCCSHLSMLSQHLDLESLAGEAVDNKVNQLYSCLEEAKENAYEHLPKETKESIVKADKTYVSIKLEVLFKTLAELLESSFDDDPTKLVIVSQWTKMLGIVRYHLNERGYSFTVIDGAVACQKRIELVEKFNNDPKSWKILLLSLKAGGEGLNLTAANHIFLLDCHWNPAVENQAADRIYRVGQRKECFVHKFVCKKTIEEKIVELQREKTTLADSILNGYDQEEAQRLSLRDLRILFGMERPMFPMQLPPKEQCYIEASSILRSRPTTAASLPAPPQAAASTSESNTGAPSKPFVAKAKLNLPKPKPPPMNQLTTRRVPDAVAVLAEAEREGGAIAPSIAQQMAAFRFTPCEEVPRPHSRPAAQAPVAQSVPRLSTMYSVPVGGPKPYTLPTTVRSATGAQSSAPSGSRTQPANHRDFPPTMFQNPVATFNPPRTDPLLPHLGTAYSSPAHQENHQEKKTFVFMPSEHTNEKDQSKKQESKKDCGPGLKTSPPAASVSGSRADGGSGNKGAKNKQPHDDKMLKMPRLRGADRESDDSTDDDDDDGTSGACAQQKRKPVLAGELAAMQHQLSHLGLNDGNKGVSGGATAGGATRGGSAAAESSGGSKKAGNATRRGTKGGGTGAKGGGAMGSMANAGAAKGGGAKGTAGGAGATLNKSGGAAKGSTRGVAGGARGEENIAGRGSASREESPQGAVGGAAACCAEYSPSDDGDSSTCIKPSPNGKLGKMPVVVGGARRNQRSNRRALCTRAACTDTSCLCKHHKEELEKLEEERRQLELEKKLKKQAKKKDDRDKNGGEKS